MKDFIKIFVVLLLFLLATSVFASWYSSDWPYRKAITIDHDKVAGNLTDFPVLIHLPADTDLASKAQSDADDILFTASDGTTKLAHEIEKFDPSTGELIAWVKVPTLSSSTDTTIYLYYGNASASNQQDPENVWSNGYVMVQHMDETDINFYDSTSYDNNGTLYGVWRYRRPITITNSTGSTLTDYQVRIENPMYNETGLVLSLHFDEGSGTTAKDSSGKNNDGTINGATWTTGKFGNALSFDDTDDYVNIPQSTTLPYGSTPRTVAMWIYVNSSSWQQNVNTIFHYGARTTRQAFGLDMDDYPYMQFYTWADDLLFDAGVPQEGWVHVVLVYDGDVTIKAYTQGQLRG